MKVAFAGRLDAAEQARWLEALARALPEVTWVTQWAEGERVDAAVVANPPAGALRTLTGLRLIQSLWAGVERLIADDTLPADVPLARMVDPAMNAAMAETALWATLGLHRGFFAYARQQREGRWHQREQERAGEVPVLVLGLGAMGAAAAERIAAMGYPVTGWRSGALGPVPAGVALAVGGAGLAQALAGARVVINLLPLTPSTRGLLDARFFSALPPGAGIVNLARGGHVVDADLLAALASGQVAHAVLDVFATEPLPADHAFWSHPQVTVLPHVAALTDARSAAEVVAANLRRLRDGAPLQHLVQRQRGY